MLDNSSSSSKKQRGTRCVNCLLSKTVPPVFDYLLIEIEKDKRKYFGATSHTMATPYMDSNLRSVTPATSNSRFAGRYPSGTRAQQPESPQYGSTGYNRRDDTMSGTMDSRAPSSTGLIRLTLKKPMGIVFEPMYDPNQPSVQRGVRICDLPRTGAAALSRKLQIGDELLQINDTTVSRMTFDEIMDFIIEADPDSVNLLFRRPRKETLQARQGVQQKLNAAANKDTPSTVKWDEAVDAEKSKDKKSGKDKNGKYSRKKRTKKGSVSEEDDTLQSSVADSYEKRGRRKKNKSRRGGPYESESFLDLLIDTICSNSNGICRDMYRKDDDYSYEDDSFTSEFDEDTYATYEESVEHRPEKSSKKKSKYDDSSVEIDSRRNHRRDEKNKGKSNSKKYEDDRTLETVESTDRAKEERRTVSIPQPPLGLAPDPVLPIHAAPILPVIVGEGEDEMNRAPIRELEYDEDNGADVSVMESLGGPSLLIEKQRAIALQSPKPSQTVPKDIIDNYGLDFLPAYGMTRAETIQNDPIKFYSYVVKQLLEMNEPEKVRLLDKLMAKYKGREDHLVQKLSVRYNKTSDGEVGNVAEGNAHEANQNDMEFSDAVKKSKESYNATAAVNIAKDRMHAVSPIGGGMHDDWPEKEHKEEEYDDIEEEENSISGSDYSGDSVDGTSPAVIAQVSELLNYVYGKTSVPGQIDRVSTIMRAYEGREAVLLELLETKALIKANKEKESEGDLPAFLRNSNMSQASRNAEELSGGMPPVTPMATQGQGTLINDDISSMSGVSNPAPESYGNRYGMVSCSRIFMSRIFCFLTNFLL